jgi:predicted phage terminase large subunit-like protein
MGALQVGDEVIAGDGSVTRVIAKSPVWKNREVYSVRTDDGFEIVADAAHEWPVRLARSYPIIRNKTTEYLFNRQAIRNPRLRVAPCVRFVERPLPLDPYVLGAWLGDGTSQCAVMTAPAEDGAFIESEFRAAGFATRRHKDQKNFGFLGGNKILRLMGLIGNKHIPQEYLRASRAQRVALLQGLVDTDGYVTPGKGIVEYCTTSQALADGAWELITSLGLKCQRYEQRAKLYGKDCGPKWRLYFYFAEAARMPRKRQHCRDQDRYANRYLTITEAGRADTVCIQVAHESSTFLCGRGFVLTHNSEILSRKGPAWISGRDPHANMILASYNQPNADKFGGEVRELVESAAHQQVFPDYGGLRKGQQDYLVTDKGGQLAFVGVGGSGTGRPADYFFCDDPIKSSEEANSETFREKLWEWFNRVCFTRAHDGTSILVVHTRWHEDDLIGRLCDPDHPERDKKYAGIAKRWTYINLPAVIEDPDLAKALGLTLEEQTDDDVVKQFGKKPISSLWPGRKSLPLLAEAKQQDSRTFNALYMGRPTPEDGEYFKEGWLVPYHSPAEVPKNLRHYGASDHATGAKNSNDYTVVGCVGIDEDGDVWVRDDVVMRKMETDVTVDELLLQFLTHKPQLWWMESELISKSFGPFLKKLMHEKRIYTTIDPVVVHKDKQTRARAIQGRMSHGRVHFPVYAPWWPEAKAQLLKFPFGTNDDFVDWLAHIGMGLLKEIPAATTHTPARVIEVGSPAWILAQTKIRARNEDRKKAVAGW